MDNMIKILLGIIILTVMLDAKNKCIKVKNGITIECYGYKKNDNNIEIKDGKFTIFYKNGNIQKSGFYKENKLDGIFKWYSKSGNLITKCLYKDNLPYNGTCLKTGFSSYKDDILFQGYSIVKYKNFKLNGKIKRFDRDNKLNAVFIYKNNILKNKKTWINKNNYKINILDNNIKEGLWEYRDNDGLLESVKHYKNGVLNGEVIEYGIFQRVIKRENYKNGKKVQKVQKVIKKEIVQKKKFSDFKYTIQIGVYKSSNQEVYKYINKLEKVNIYSYIRYKDETIELYSGRFISFKDAKKRLIQIKKVVKDAYVKGI